MACVRVCWKKGLLLLLLVLSPLSRAVGSNNQQHSRVSALLALVVEKVAIPCRRPREFGAAVRACRLGSLPRLFSLMP